MELQVVFDKICLSAIKNSSARPHPLELTALVPHLFLFPIFEVFQLKMFSFISSSGMSENDSYFTEIQPLYHSDLCPPFSICFFVHVNLEGFNYECRNKCYTPSTDYNCNLLWQYFISSSQLSFIFSTRQPSKLEQDNFFITI